MDYKISLDSYEGSIESLHSLIKRDEIDIMDVPLARILEGYFQWIKVNLVDLDTAGEFLALAAHLLLIKVRMLLPVRESEVQEEFEEDVLLERNFQSRMIQQYRKFKELTQEMAVREKHVLQHHSRPLSLMEFEDETEEGVSFLELLRALKNVMEKVKAHSSYEVSLDEIDLQTKLDEILHVLTSKRKILFEELFAHQTRRIEIIVTFMAILELVRMKRVLVRQTKIFGDIWVYERN